MIRTMASPGQESESFNSQSLVDSMRTMIHTARPDGYLDYFNNRLARVPGRHYVRRVPVDVYGFHSPRH
jgi:hypothetical protein